MDENRNQGQGQPNQNEDRLNPNANREPAEGSRENVRANRGGGITNRPLDQEQREQSEVPARGKTKSEDREMPDITNEPLSPEEASRRGIKDIGKTSGGGSLGHDQPADAERPKPRNTEDPVMPQDDPTLGTKI